MTEKLLKKTDEVSSFRIPNVNNVFWIRLSSTPSSMLWIITKNFIEFVFLGLEKMSHNR